MNTKTNPQMRVSVMTKSCKGKGKPAKKKGY